MEKVGDDADGGTPRRKALGAEGLDERLCSFSASLFGEGVSSIMRTHPELSGLGVVTPLVKPVSTPSRCGVGLASLLSGITDRGKGLLGANVEDIVDVEAIVEIALVPCRPALLPIRNRGTRVWIFCSRFLTRARISETI